MYPFAPDWCVPPGATIKELLGEHHSSQRALARQMGCHYKVVRDLIVGRVPLTPIIATSLEQVFGVPARLWLALEKSYRDGIAQGLHRW